MLGLGDRMGPPSSSPGQGRNRGQEGAPSLPLVSSCQVCRALNYSLRECRPAVGVRGRPIWLWTCCGTSAKHCLSVQQGGVEVPSHPVCFPVCP